MITAPAVLARRFGRFRKPTLAVAIVPYALLGLVLTFLACISPLPYVRMNETCFLWLPFDLLVLFLPAAKARLYARGRVAMLVLMALLMLINVVKQPLFAPLLWPLIPMAIVGLWPETAPVATEAKPVDAKTESKKPSTRKKRGGRRS